MRVTADFIKNEIVIGEFCAATHMVLDTIIHCQELDASCKESGLCNMRLRLPTPASTVTLLAADFNVVSHSMHGTFLQASKNLAITEGNSKVSGALYMAGEEHLQLLLDTYNLFSHTNPLHTEVWPSMRQMESDVIAMTAAMLGGDLHLVFNTFQPSMHLQHS